MTTSPYAVPYSALPYQAAEVKQELLSSIEAVLDSGRYIMGPEVTAFEREFAAYCQSPRSLGVANGTCALRLVLEGLRLKEGDEVITVPNSFVATAATIALVRAKPVFVDIRPDLNIDPERIEAAITPRTRGIIAVHLTGRPASMPEVLEIARRRNLFVLEDAAQAVGAALDGRRVGSLGRAACFSLHPLKNLHACGDGGMVTSGDGDLLDHVAKARNHGLRSRDTCDFWSCNCRLDEVQAAMLRVHLRHLDRRTQERRRLAFRYNELLRPFVDVPLEGPGEYCVYQTYVIQADRRDDLKGYLTENGVEALIHYPTPLHLQPAARSLGYTANDFPMTMRAASRILSLPLYPGLTEAQQDRVVGLIEAFYKHHQAGATAA
jgi:dTDP-4-amino-4,6-dideoxygalactose transaminase